MKKSVDEMATIFQYLGMGRVHYPAGAPAGYPAGYPVAGYWYPV